MAYGPQRLLLGKRVNSAGVLNTGTVIAPAAGYSVWRYAMIVSPSFLLLLLWYTSVPLSTPRTAEPNHAAKIPQVQYGEQGVARTPPAAALPSSSSATAAAFTQGLEVLHAQQYEQAVALFEYAARLDARNAEYHLWLGRAYGYQARQANEGAQFFLARKVRKHLETAVALDPDQLAARLDLLDYYLQAPGLLGGGADKAKAQAEEIAKRDPHQGAVARQRCQQAETQAPLFAASALD